MRWSRGQGYDFGNLFSRRFNGCRGLTATVAGCKDGSIPGNAFSRDNQVCATASSDAETRRFAMDFLASITVLICLLLLAES